MAKHTVASLAADLSATRSALNTYIALHQQLEAELYDLRKHVLATKTVARELHTPNAEYAVRCAARRNAVAAFVRDNPSARSCTTEDLAQYM